MNEFLAKLLQKSEPLLKAYRVPVSMATTLVLFTGLVVSAGVDGSTGSNRVTTKDPQLADAGEPGGDVGEAVAGGADSAAATATGAAPTAAAARVPVKGPTITKGGVSITTFDGVPIANLFTKDEDRIGMSDTGGKFGKGQVTLCGHAATTFGPAFNTDIDSLDVYWRDLNSRGGVFGRDVVTSWEDDVYDPSLAVRAATACKQKNPFILLGGIGFEQIPAVRNYVEEQHMFYIHHMARSDLTKKYSFGPLPTVERTGTLAGDWVRRKFPNAKVGIIYRDSEYWIPGKDAFIQALGRQPVAQEKVYKNQGSYHAQVLAMQQGGADLVFAWENALAQSAMIKEAEEFRPLPYQPQWIVFPFNLVTDTVGEAAIRPGKVMHGISTWAAYSPGDYTGPFAEYADEIRRFEAAYKTHHRTAYDSGLTDIHWMTWLAWRSIHYTLEQCGRDCTRNKFLGSMIYKPYEYPTTKPSCPTDFTRNGHEGGYWASTFEAYKRPNGSVGWKHLQHCRESWT